MPSEPPTETPSQRPLPPEEPLLEPKAIPNPNELQGTLDAYGDAIKFALILNLSILIFAAGIMDDGLVRAITIIGMGAHFGSSLVNMLMVRQNPSIIDLIWVRFGLFPCLGLIPIYMTLTGGSYRW